MAEPITNVLGTVAIKHCGEYDATMHYEKLNVVTYNGSSYCAKDNTVGNLPTNTTYWDLMAEKGDKGDTGEAGYTPVKGTDYYTAADKAELESTLSSDVSDEVTDQLGDLTSATPLVASSTAGMTDTTRIYVNSTDGHWYWYNGTTWVDGGVYQATGIGEDSVSGSNLYNNDLIPVYDNQLLIPNWLIGTYSNYSEYRCCSSKIPVNIGDVIKMTNVIGASCVGLDENDNYLAPILNSDTLQAVMTATISNANIKYVVFNFSTIEKQEAYINGTSVSQYNVNWLNVNNKNFANNTLLGQKLLDNSIHPSKLMKSAGLELENGKTWNVNPPYTSTFSNFCRTKDLIDVNEGDVIHIKNTRASAIIIYTLDEQGDISSARQLYNANVFNPTVIIREGESKIGINFEKSKLDDIELYINNVRIYVDYKKYQLDWLDFNDDQIERLGLNSHVKNYKILFIGDSITEDNFRSNVNWVDNIVNWFGITNYTNGGMSGTGILRKYGNYPNWYNKLDDYSNDYNLILIMGDMNDWSNKIFTSENIGQFGDNTLDTFYGTMKLYLEKILNKYPLAKIGWITSTPRDQIISGTTDHLHGNSSIFKQANDIIKEMCNNYSIPCLELYNCSDLHPWIQANNQEYFTAPNSEIPDGVHPNDAGQLIMSYKIKSFINNNF